MSAESESKSEYAGGHRGAGYALSVIPILAVLAFILIFAAAGFHYVFGPERTTHGAIPQANGEPMQQPATGRG